MLGTVSNSARIVCVRSNGQSTGTPITLLKDASGDLWYKHFRIDKIDFDEARNTGHLHGVDTAKNAQVLVSISAKPIVKPLLPSWG